MLTLQTLAKPVCSVVFVDIYISILIIVAEVNGYHGVCCIAMAMTLKT